MPDSIIVERQRSILLPNSGFKRDQSPSTPVSGHSSVPAAWSNRISPCGGDLAVRITGAATDSPTCVSHRRKRDCAAIPCGQSPAAQV
ncbi:MAG: hypothetical protein GY866_14510 [Proteobacteria bacterium]|nr:hypothetical protein [Pseudomonadota bacterium]